MKKILYRHELLPCVLGFHQGNVEGVIVHSVQLRDKLRPCRGVQLPRRCGAGEWERSGFGSKKNRGLQEASPKEELLVRIAGLEEDHNISERTHLLS